MLLERRYHGGARIGDEIPCSNRALVRQICRLGTSRSATGMVHRLEAEMPILTP